MKYFKFFTFFWMSLNLLFMSSVDASQKLKVVVSFSILKDLTQIIGGNEVEVSSIVPLNSDPHIYQPTPDIAALISQADIVILNGLGFEGWIDRLLEATKFKGKIVISSAGISPRVLLDPALSSATSVPDPHAWHDVQHVMVYVKNICVALKEADKDPAHQHLFQQRTEDYLKKLKDLDQWIQQKFQEIPEDQRKIISAHDAFGYFAARYHLKMYALQGISTESEPSAKQVAALIDLIRQEKIKALFMENMTNHRMLDQVSAETQIDIGGTLYTDSLSDEQGPAKTYLEMMKHNVSTILRAFETK